MLTTIKEEVLTRARKKHTCGLCCQKILKDSFYYISVIRNDGELYSFKTHKHCSDIATKLNMCEDCDDEGLTALEFIDTIHGEYVNILQELQQRNNADQDPFSEWLAFVLDYHKIEHNIVIDKHNENN